MQTQIKLRDLFSYSITPIIITLILIIIIVILYFILNKKKKEITNIQIKEPINKNNIQNKYLNLINELLNKVNNNTITNRKSYQELSILIRNFIYEMTSIKVQNYTLSDIKTLNMPFLETLVEEYYTPEFSYNSKGDIINSINKTKEVIIKWQ